MLQRIRAATRRLPDSARRAVRTAAATFVGVFGVTLLGWVNDVAAWAGTSGAHFPSVNPLGKGAVSALCAAAVGLVTYLQNLAEDHGVIPAVLKAPACASKDVDTGHEYQAPLSTTLPNPR